VRARQAIGGAAALAILAGSWTGEASPQNPPAAPAVAAVVDKVFAPWNRAGMPGCAVGVSSRGRVLHLRGYGSANLEHGVPIGPDTVFESGSVAKQFTAAAISLLAQDGKLSLDDPARKFLPELPDFGAPILIRHLLSHTSGLRCQWPMLTLAGRPPGSAVHTMGEILGLVSRFRELNFKPGDEHLYCNTGFTLLAVVVERVSGESLDAFCRKRIFSPLGMERTRWRTDFAALVEGRATAYRRDPSGEYRADMPFTNVVGNGGLLTTVGDLLRWNDQLDRPRVGGDTLVASLQTKARLNDGSEIDYGQGLYILDYRGLLEVSKGGTTAGYQAYLGRFPAEGLSIAVLCNAADADPFGAAHRVADALLGDKLEKRPVARITDVAPGTLEGMTGYYLEKATDALMRLEWDPKAGGLRLEGQALLPTGDGELMTANGNRAFSTEVGWPEGLAPARLVERRDGGAPRRWEVQRRVRLTPAQLAAFAGNYVSEELGVVYTVFVAGETLEIVFQPAYRLSLTPAFADGFDGGGVTVRFTRSAAGAIDGLLVTMDRARRVRFARR